MLFVVVRSVDIFWSRVRMKTGGLVSIHERMDVKDHAHFFTGKSLRHIMARQRTHASAKHTHI